MGKLTPQKFIVEQFQDQASWIGPMFSSLNAFINDVVIAFNNNLNIADNLYQEIKEIKFKNSSVNFPLKFRTKYSVYPKGMIPIFLFNETLSANSGQVPVLTWSYSNGEISISSLTGLTADSTYTIRLLVING